MTLIIETPANRTPERVYILQVLLRDFLGLEWRHQPSARCDTRITLTNCLGEIRLPDILLSLSDEQWLTPESMPRRPFFVWDTRELAADITLVEPRLPIIYSNHTDPEIQEDFITLPVDILGSAFFMLTRYEEMVVPDRDEHERFPSWASVAYQENFLHRPIVDEYTEVLWTAMHKLWPQLERKKNQFKTFVTCDVDSAISFRGNWKKVLKRFGSDLLKQRSPQLAVSTLMATIRSSLGNLESDPHWHGLRWIMDTSEEENISVSFYLIPAITDSRKDHPISLDDTRMRKMIHEMHERGHEIGIHPGYNTFQHPEAMAKSVARMKMVINKQGIDQPLLGGRQHFLRWKTPETMRLWHDYGLSYDSTLSYADRPGFRCGTCREYTLFDVGMSSKLHLRERPLILMECSIIANRYLGMGYSNNALETMLYYKRICQKFDGNFVFLWHNSHLNRHKDKLFFKSLVGND